MPENAPSPSSPNAVVRMHLHMISQLLRHVHHLRPEAQELLADLVDELEKSLATAEVPSVEITRLTECATQLVHAVREGEDEGVLESARARLERAVIAAEAEAPVLAGLTRRLADMLANLGI